MKYNTPLAKSDWYVASANDPSDMAAFKFARKRALYPAPDTLDLKPEMADRLYELGVCSDPIYLNAVPLPIFEVSMFIDDSDAEANSIIQPVNPHRSETGCYAFSLLFVAGSNAVFCYMNLSDSNDSSGGDNDVCVFSFTDHGDDGMEISPYALNDDILNIWHISEIEKIARWFTVLWKGIQYKFQNRPEVIRIHYKRTPKECSDSYKKQLGKNTHIVKVQRVITIEKDEDTAIEYDIVPHVILCPCWGVIGHWRQYKSGKRVWIKSYVKGKERDISKEYVGKKYMFTEEGDNANA